MRLTLLVGETEAQADFDSVAESGGRLLWVVPKTARPGDEALFLFNRALLKGRGIVESLPVRGSHGRRAVYQAEIGKVERLDPPLSLDEVRRSIPEWEWPTYPRSFTTPRPDIASKLLELLRRSGTQLSAASAPHSAGRQASDEDPGVTGEDIAVLWNALLPERHRMAAARALSQSIVAAHALREACWTLTARRDLIRLDVGMPYALTLFSDKCDLLLMDDPGLLRALARDGVRVQKLQEFQRAPGTIGVRLPLRSLAEVHARTWRSHLDAMAIAAAQQPSTPHRGYSFALMEHLRTMGFDLPDSMCPEAVSLRDSRPRSPIAASAPEPEPFLPGSAGDAAQRVLASIVRRRGQPAFRSALLQAYDFRCALTDCTVLEVLEAAHIVPYRGAATNHVQNGILLRADLHTLFDLKLLDFDDRWRVRLEPSLKRSWYAELDGKPLRLPKEKSCRPSLEALAVRRMERT
jgi:hypothetical protein